MGRTTLIAVVIAAAAALAWFVLRTEAPSKVEQPAPIEGSEERAPEPVRLEGAGEEPDASGKEATEGSPNPESQPTPPAAALPHRVTGLVTDTAGDPVEGATVDLLHIHGRGERVSTDAKGRFELRAGSTRLLAATLVARQGERIATRMIYLGATPDTMQVGTLVLRAGHFVDVVVRSLCPAVPPATLVVQHQGAHGSGGTVARAETDAEGRARLGPLPAGSCRVFAFADGCGRGDAVVSLPQEHAVSVEIDVEEARDVAVTVVESGTEEPVEGAVLELTEYLRHAGHTRVVRYMPALSVAPTNAQGVTTISGLTKSASLRVEVHVEGRPSVGAGVYGLRQPRIEAEVTEVRIVLPPLRTVRWLITDKEGAIPEDGTPLTLQHGPQAKWVPLPKGGRIEDGHIVVDSLLPTFIHGLAVAPDGSIARLFAKDTAELGMETSFRTARTIEVVASYADGGPVTGMWASLRGPGNNQVGDIVPLNEEGRALFEGLHGMKVTVYLSKVKSAYGGNAIGSVDLDAGSGRVEAKLARTREVLLHITLDSKPGVPANMVAQTWTGMSSISWPVEVIDRAKGLARIQWQPAAPGGTARLNLHTPGWVPEEPTFVLKLEDKGSEPIERNVALVSGGTLQLRVVMPPNGRANITPQRWINEKQSWVTEHGTPVQVAADGLARLTPLRAGRYRMASRSGGGVSAEVEVRAGEVATLDFDLSKEGIVTGRVDVPEGVDASEAKVVIEGRSYTQPGNDGQSVRENGVFHVMVTGTEEVVLRAQHPLLVPAEDGGEAKVREPGEGIVLKLVRGPRISATLDPAPPEAFPWALPRLVAFKGPVTSVAEGRVVPMSIEAGQLTCGSLPSGTWTLWLDIRGFIPITLEDVVVAKEGVDLGTLSLSKGSSLRLIYKVKEGESSPRVTVWASALSEPRYFRGTNTDDAEILVSGLGAGRFKVTVSPQGGGPGSFSEEIEFDGTSTVERTIDLR